MAETPLKESQQAEAVLKTFFSAYAANMAGKGDRDAEKQLLDHYLTDALVHKVQKVGEENGYDLLVRAQDFNTKAVETIAVIHIDGDWYAVSYLDTSYNRCVIIPVKMTKVDGKFRLDDIKTVH